MIAGDIENEAQPLDGFIVAGILSSYLRSVPNKKPFLLPHFRLKHLLEKAATPFSGQPSLIESLGSLYCIALYCATSPVFENDEDLVSSVLVLESTACECIHVMQHALQDGYSPGSIRILHPDEVILKHKPQTVITTGLVESLLSGFDLAKDIVRDITRQVRNANEKSKAKEVLKDSFLAHSAYFLCCFGIAHVAAKLKMANNLNAIPGVIESLLLMTLCTYDGPDPSEQAAEKSRPSSSQESGRAGTPGANKLGRIEKDSPKQQTTPTRLDEVDEYRIKRCMATASRLGLATILFSFDERVLQEIKLVRGRMIKRLMHTDCSFASVRASGFRHFLESHKHKSSSDAMQSVATRRRNQLALEVTNETGGGSPHKGDHMNSSEKSEGDNDGDSFIPGVLLSEGGLKYRPEVFKAPESDDDRNIEKMMKIDSGWLDFSAPKPADEDDEYDEDEEDVDMGDNAGDNDNPTDNGDQTNTVEDTVSGQLTKSAKTSILETQEEMDVSLGDSNFNNKPSAKSKMPVKAVVFKTKPVKSRGGAGVDELSLSAREGQPWKLLRHFRDAYLYIAPLRKKQSTRHFFVADYVPRPQRTDIRTATAKTGLSAQDLVPACHKIEYSYFNIDQHFVPRLLLPSSPLYWIVTDLVNYLHLKTINGTGFKRSEDSVRSELHVDVKVMRDLRLDAPIDTGPVRGPLPEIGKSKAAQGKKTADNKDKGSSAMSLLAMAMQDPKKATGEDADSKTEAGSVASRSFCSNLVRNQRQKGAVSKADLPALSIADKLRMATKEARAECRLMELEKKKQEEQTKGPRATSLKKIDATLREGLTILKNIKTKERVAGKSSVGIVGGGGVSAMPSIAESTVGGEVSALSPGDSLMLTHRSDRSDRSEQSHHSENSQNSETSNLDTSRSSSKSKEGGSGSKKGSRATRKRPTDPVRQFMQDPSVKDIEKFRRAIRDSGLIEDPFGKKDALLEAAAGVDSASHASGARNEIVALSSLGDDTKGKLISEVWVYNEVPQGSPDRFLGNKVLRKKDKDEGPMIKLSDEVKREYAKTILDFQRERRDHEEEKKDFLKYQIEKTLAAEKERKRREALEAKEKQKADLLAARQLRAKYMEEKKAIALEAKRALKAQRKKEQDDLQDFKEYVDRVKFAAQLKEEKQMEHHIAEIQEEEEKIRQSNLRRELEENLRRLQEEQRMRYLEERRRETEMRLEAERSAKRSVKQMKREKCQTEVEKAVRKVRMGAFDYHSGQFSFYREMRAEPPEWLAFEDLEGKTVYYDPITKKSQRRLPTDGPVRVADKDDTRWWDAIYGPGAYEAHLADIAFKDAYNANQGYYDAEGNWQIATGYYDQNYEFVGYDGFYDEEGRYILYPKPVGDLSFMV